MRLKSETYEELKQMVADMFVDYDIKSVPICAFEIALKMNMIVIPYSALEETAKQQALDCSKDGYSVETSDGKWIIYYNDDVTKKYERINQTIMHEIAHFILGHINGDEEEEAEAKFFAKYALVSPVLIHNMHCEKTVENIMGEFLLSYQAAVIAFDNYQKRVCYGPKNYEIYELQILKQLEICVA